MPNSETKSVLLVTKPPIPNLTITKLHCRHSITSQTRTQPSIQNHHDLPFTTRPSLFTCKSQNPNYKIDLIPCLQPKPTTAKPPPAIAALHSPAVMPAPPLHHISAPPHQTLITARNQPSYPEITSASHPYHRAALSPAEAASISKPRT
ncbi:hypothetical protein M0R45_035894 [Rubus argutus]|uniref:Uncharacterized protein n=1 Tax=Rubus argutus TaxID=59490 RepID=A0AAW1VWA9_RUBAR